MPKVVRISIALLVFAVPICVIPRADAQIPIPIQEQVELFSTLSPAQQQALIRELQSQLPPAQRDAVLGMLMQGQQGAASRTPGSPAEIDVGEFSANFLDTLELEESGIAFSAGDTLVVEFEIPEDVPAADVLELAEFLERLEDGNPYELDAVGRLYLPGVPPIALAGLNVEQATIRLGAERDLRPFDLVVTHLPLDRVGTEALEPYGYELFRNSRFGLDLATDIPVPVDYVIGPGDTINVQLFGSQSAEYFLTVSSEGTINFPEIGPLNVSGQSFVDVRDLISERVMEQLSAAVRVSTTLGELRSISVFVLGDALRPGTYTVSGLATVTNALRISGGVSDIGSLRSIALNRGGTAVTTLDLYDLLLNGDTSDDARLQQGDVIFIPPVGSTIAVDGEVRRPAVYELNGEQTVAEVIALAGGLRANASQNAVKLERIVPGSGIAVTDVDLALAAGGETQVRDGDVLRVEPNLAQLDASVRLDGNVQRPGLYQWRSGMTVSQLLPTPELVKPLSDLNYVLIRRETTPNIEIDALSVDLEAVWQGRAGAADLILQPRDTVYVFHIESGRKQYVAPIVEEIKAQASAAELTPLVRIGGEVRAEGEYPLEPGMRVGDLLRAGGGLTDAAYAIDAELTRYSVIGGESRQTDLIAIDLAAVLSGNAAENIVLSPYDFLSIKEISGWRGEEAVRLRGEFVFPGTYAIRQGERLSSVFERAGGLTEFAFPAGSIFTRVELRERELEQLETLAQRVEADLAARALSDDGASDALAIGQSLLAQLRDAEATGRLVIHLDELVAGNVDADIILHSGDELFVPEFRQEVTVIGEVQYPTSHSYNSGLSRDDYLDRSGGLTQRADQKRIYIVRANGEVVADGGGRWFRRDNQAQVGPGDTIVVPLEVDRVRPLSLWTSVTGIVYNLAIAAAAVNSF